MSSHEAPVEVPANDLLGIATSTAIKEGDIQALRALLAHNPNLAAALITSEGPDGLPEARSLLHIATDWPGHFLNIAETIHLLASAGAKVSAPFGRGAAGAAPGHPPPPHVETPLHWAASTDDIAALDALLDEGADIEAPGSVLGDGPPLDNAVGFKQWQAAERLVERGAEVTLAQAAGMGLTGRVEAMLLQMESDKGSRTGEGGGDYVSRAFWYACHGGRLDVARVLVRHGADVNWRPPWDGDVRPLDAAGEGGDEELVRWLREQGAVTGRRESGSKNEKAAAK